MSYTIEQKIGNHTYLYEVESYWDPEKKQPRQRRKYLGKKDPESGHLVRPRTRGAPRLCKDYGQVYLLNWLQVLTCAKLPKVNECEGDEFEAEMIFLFCLKA
jgi:hypothetical protein